MVASMALNCGQTPRYERLEISCEKELCHQDSRRVPALDDGMPHHAHITAIGYFLLISSPPAFHSGDSRHREYKPKSYSSPHRSAQSTISSSPNLAFDPSSFQRHMWDLPEQKSLRTRLQTTHHPLQKRLLRYTSFLAFSPKVLPSTPHPPSAFRQ